MKIESAAFELSAGLVHQLPASNLPEVAFSGRSNVGKSSLINRLLNRKALARTSATPGKTATINFYRLDTLRLVDLPGYGYAKGFRRRKTAMERPDRGVSGGRPELCLVVQLLDARHAPSADDRTMLDYLVQREIPFLVVLTKMDKLNVIPTCPTASGLSGGVCFAGRADSGAIFGSDRGRDAGAAENTDRNSGRMTTERMEDTPC